MVFSSSFWQAASQSIEESRTIYNTSIDWLNAKLNYTYFESKNQNWWLNTFYVNEQYEVTLKHVVSKKRSTVKLDEKDYNIRKFNLYDINPESIAVSEMASAQGRIAKGKLVELRTFSNASSIHKKINNKRASSTSYLHLSFPAFMLDTLSNYAEMVQHHFHQAIVAATTVYAKADPRENATQILDLMAGTFESSEGQELKIVRMAPNLLKWEHTKDGTFQFLGYDPNKQKLYHSTLSNDGIATTFYNITLNEDQQLRLTHPSAKTSTDLLIDTRNQFTWKGTLYKRK